MLSLQVYDSSLGYLLPQVRPMALSRTLLELATKKHTKDHIKREYELMRLCRINAAADPGMFSDFGNPKLYGGLVPSGCLLATSFFFACVIYTDLCFATPQTNNLWRSLGIVAGHR